jgi:hypothetical protein
MTLKFNISSGTEMRGSGTTLKSSCRTLREIIIGGGEPMLIKEHLNFIKECAESERLITFI